MKKVGILTWYYGANYGALAQSIALYNTIKHMGYDCKLINYKPKNYLKTILGANLPQYKEFYKVSSIINGIKKITHLSITKYFEVTKKVNSVDDINKLDQDRIVLGSDAIFNMEHPLCDSVFYGVGIKCNKVTYSPSCEYLDPNYLLPEEYRKSLKEMKMISVRDVNTYNLVEKNTGIKPQITLDPTFLYDFAEIGEDVCQDKYLLIYSFSAWNEFGPVISEYAKNNGMKIVCLGQYVKWADFSIENATFEQWIGAFRKASIVMTDSFHGTVFSIKNKKQIILCGRKDKKAKIDSLLKQVGITLDIFEGEKVEQYLSNNTIDYTEKQPIIDSEIKKSLNYLTQALR